jgi:serine/threonine-protein kinase
MLVALATKPPIPLRAKRPDAPDALSSVILRCLQRERDKRIGSASELARALAPFGSERTKHLPDRIAEILARVSMAPASIRAAAPSEAAAGQAAAAKGPLNPPNENKSSEMASPAPAPALPEARPRRKAFILKLALVVALLLGLAMIVQASLKAARKLGPPGAEGSSRPASSAPSRQ